jgi:hypothetical protein
MTLDAKGKPPSSREQTCSFAQMMPAHGGTKSIIVEWHLLKGEKHGS